jgi:two-component system sensor histidine kinase UhpB
VGQEAALDEGTVSDIIPDDQASAFRALELAGCIDKLTIPLRQDGILVRWETPHHDIKIPADRAALLYQAAQDTLTGALKYSQATKLTLGLEAVDQGIRLTITDDGFGFQRQLLGGSKHGYGVCLVAMAVHETGGTISIDSVPHKGTRVSIILPLD